MPGGASEKRRQTPDVEGEEDLDLPTTSDGNHPTSAVANTVKPHGKEPQRPMGDIIAYDKLKFGKKLIVLCLLIIVVLCLVGYFFDGAKPDSSELHTAIELLKLVTTTALGFVFGRTGDHHGEDSSGA